MWSGHIPTHSRPTLSSSTYYQIVRRASRTGKGTPATNSLIHSSTLPLLHKSAATRLVDQRIYGAAPEASSPLPVRDDPRGHATSSNSVWLPRQASAVQALADKALTYETAIQIAQSSETAEKGAKDLAGAAMHKLYAGKQRHPQPPRLPSNAQPPILPCYRCGTAHTQATCRCKTASCHYCQKQGHLASVCRKKARDLKGKKGKNYAKNHQLEAAPNSDTDDSDVVPYPLFYSATPRPKPIEVSVLLNNVETTMEIDTGATFSIISEDTYKTFWQSDVRPPLKSSSARLSTYTGEKICVLGQITMRVSYHQQKNKLPLLVVPDVGPSLLGRNWLEHIHIDWPWIHRLHSPPDQ